MVAQDAVEDAVVIEETAADDPARDTAANPAEANESPEGPETRDEATGTAEEDAGASPDRPVPADRRRSGAGAFAGVVLGGVVAGAIGFGVAQYFVPGSWPFGSDEPAEDPVAAALEVQSGELDELKALVAAQGQSIAELEADTSVEELGGSLRADIVATQKRIEDLGARMDGVEDRLSALEKMPQGDSAQAAETAAAAYERELTEMRAMLERELANLTARQEDAETLQANAAEAARAASARAALSRIMAALDSGQPFEDALFDLTTATGLDAPAALAAAAADGVPTLTRLQADFPAMARAALDDALRAMVEAGEIGRGEAFLRTQLGSRSLEPQEGDDPDAILSRAEFALKNGRISEALDTLATMPEAAGPAMADWIAAAQARAEALGAGAALAQDLNKQG